MFRENIYLYVYINVKWNLNSILVCTIFIVMPQFDWLCDVCGCVMSPTSGIYLVELGFINNYKEPQLWLVLLRYNAYVASAFSWVVTLMNNVKEMPQKKRRGYNYGKGVFISWVVTFMNNVKEMPQKKRRGYNYGKGVFNLKGHIN